MLGALQKPLEKGISKGLEDSWSQAIEKERDRACVGQIDRKKEKRNLLPEEKERDGNHIYYSKSEKHKSREMLRNQHNVPQWDRTDMEKQWVPV